LTPRRPRWFRLRRNSVQNGSASLAAVDRLVHHSTILEMNVESYRRRAAQQGLAPAARRRR
jgi:DNA replication protein DnaC